MFYLINRRDKAIFNVAFHTRLRITGVGIHPADHEDCVSLIDQPFDHAVLLFEVENIVFVDPRRKDQQRNLVYLFRRWCELDQLIHTVAEHNFAWACRNIFADFEGALVR